MLYKILIITLSVCCFGFTSNRSPEGLPPNLPSKIKGNYRLIEHDASGSTWVAYDFNKYSRTSDGFKMYPPVYSYDWLPGKKQWLKRTERTAQENMYTTELVTIIDAKAQLTQKPAEGRPLSAQEATAKVSSAIKNPSAWRLSSKPFKSAKGKDGVIICGRNTVNTSAIGVWWSSGGKISSVNGTAKGTTPAFEMTYDVGTSEGLSLCK